MIEDTIPMQLELLSEKDEIWREHPVWKTFYASSKGRIVSISEHRVNPKFLSTSGKLELTRGTRQTGSYTRKQYLPHRFVWECFRGEVPYEDTRQIVFKDGDRRNLSIDNLEMVMPAKRIKMTAQGA